MKSVDTYQAEKYFPAPVVESSVLQEQTQDKKTGLEGKYIGKIARVIEPVNKFKGAITIYDERWDARYDGDEEIPVGAEIRIVRNESLVMYVEKI